MGINIDWHKTHKMPAKLSLKEKIKWHKEHQIECTCRPVPHEITEKLIKFKKNEIKKQ